MRVPGTHRVQGTREPRELLVATVAAEMSLGVEFVKVVPIMAMDGTG